jgi:hypothetical protein
VLGSRYSLTAQLAGAWSREVDETEDGAPPAPGETLFGPLFSAQLARSGRVFSWRTGIEDVHPDFRARTGFIRRLGDTQVNGEIRYTFLREAGSWLEDWGPQLEVRAFYDHDDFWAGRGFQEAEIEAGLDLSLRGPNGFNLGVSDGYFSFDPADYEGYQAPTAPGPGLGPYVPPDHLERLLSFRLFGRTRPLPWLSINGRGSYGEVPIYAEGSRGVELSLGPSAEIRFPMGLSTDLSYNYSRIRREDGDRFSTAQIPRLKVQYQFSKALFARAIVQYNLQKRDALRTPDGAPLTIDGELSQEVREGQLQYDLLLSYEPSPGTIVYAGWSRVREGLDTYRFGDLTPVAEGLFVKLSYLFRL